MNWRRSLKTRIILITLTVFLTGLWSFAFFEARMLRKDMERLLGEQQFATVSMVAAQVDREIAERFRALNKVARLSHGMLQDWPVAMQTFLDGRFDLQVLFNGGVFITGTDGIVLADSPVTSGRLGVNNLERDDMVGALLEGRETISRPIVGRLSNEPVFVMAVPIRDVQGTVIGALAGTTHLGPSNFLDRITTGRYGKTGDYLLVAPRYRLVVTASDKRLIMTALPAEGVNQAIDRSLAGREGTEVLIGRNGTEVLASTKGIPAAGWLAVASLPTEEAFAPIRDMQRRMILAALLFTLVAVVLTWWLLKHQLAPLLTTARTLAGMSASDRPAQPIPVLRNDEIGQLIEGFNRLLAKLGHREEALRESELSLRRLIHAIPDLVWLKDPQGVFVACNRRFERLYGASEEEIVGKTDYDFVDRDSADAFRSHDRAAMDKGEALQNEEWVTFADGHRELLETTKTPLYDSQGQLIGVLGIGHDITHRRQAEEEIRNLAFFDQLTRLPNRRLLIDRLEQSLAAGSRHLRYGVLIYIDLDNFKNLNDTHGHEIGDLLLQQVAQRLRVSVREADTVARLGGDEFVVMLVDMGGTAQEVSLHAEVVARKILATLNEPYRLDLYTHHSTPSLGIALFSDNTESVDELLKRADLAMYRAKEAGRNTLRFYDPEMQSAVAARSALEAGLREALQMGQFRLVYQPQVDSSGRVIGGEALLRWQHPERGLVSPAEFIPLAEDTGLILPIGQWVLETACTQLHAWASQPKMAGLTVAVNVSARQFHQPDFVDRVLSAIELGGARPDRLKLELTESLLVSNVEDVIVKMKALQARGVGFSLDDFGTGYSSLNYLKRLPLDQLKIDQGFVRDILVDANDAAIARMVIALGKSLGLAVVAEGVEAEAQRDFLLSQGCHAFQGYLFSRPVPPAEFAAFVESA